MNTIKEQLITYCEEHWWNGGTKKVSFKGALNTLLERHSITFSVKRINKYQCTLRFRNANGITYTVNCMYSDFSYHAKKAIQMELVRMGDPTSLYVRDTIRPVVTVNK